MSWISGLVGGISAGAGVRGANNSAGVHNKFWQPGTINQYAQGMNPWVWNAMLGKGQGQGGLQGDLYNLAQGKDISPWLLNNPLAQANQSASTNMARMQSQLGRSNMSGGLANAYALSNAMGRQANVSNIFQNYGQWREQQRRSDLNWLMGQIGESQDQGMQLANQHIFKKNLWEKLGAFGQGFIGGMGGAPIESKKPKPKPGTPPPGGPGGGAGGAASGGAGTGWGGNPQTAQGPFGPWGGNTPGVGQQPSWGNDPRTQMGTGEMNW